MGSLLFEKRSYVKRQECVSGNVIYKVLCVHDAELVALLTGICLRFICCDSLLGCEITDVGVGKVCELVRENINLVETLQ